MAYASPMKKKAWGLQYGVRGAPRREEPFVSMTSEVSRLYFSLPAHNSPHGQPSAECCAVRGRLQFFGELLSSAMAPPLGMLLLVGTLAGQTSEAQLPSQSQPS